MGQCILFLQQLSELLTSDSLLRHNMVAQMSFVSLVQDSNKIVNVNSY